MKNNVSRFAQKLKKARKEMGLSQRDLAALLQISDKAISSYEVDRATPPLATLRKISEITHKSVEYFVNEDDDQELDLKLQIKKIEHDLLEAKQALLELQNKK